MMQEEQLLAAASLLQKKEATITNLKFEINQLKQMLFKIHEEKFVSNEGNEETAWS